jgi:hypothetical protein
VSVNRVREGSLIALARALEYVDPPVDRHANGRPSRSADGTLDVVPLALLLRRNISISHVAVTSSILGSAKRRAG